MTKTVVLVVDDRAKEVTVRFALDLFQQDTVSFQANAIASEDLKFTESADVFLINNTMFESDGKTLRDIKETISRWKKVNPDAIFLIWTRETKSDTLDAFAVAVGADHLFYRLDLTRELLPRIWDFLLKRE